MDENVFFAEFKEFVEREFLKKYRTKLGPKRTSDLRTRIRSYCDENTFGAFIEKSLPSFDICEDYGTLKKAFWDYKALESKESTSNGVEKNMRTNCEGKERNKISNLNFQS